MGTIFSCGDNNTHGNVNKICKNELNSIYSEPIAKEDFIEDADKVKFKNANSSSSITPFCKISLQKFKKDGLQISESINIDRVDGSSTTTFLQHNAKSLGGVKAFDLRRQLFVLTYKGPYDGNFYEIHSAAIDTLPNYKSMIQLNCAQELIIMEHLGIYIIHKKDYFKESALIYDCLNHKPLIQFNFGCALGGTLGKYYLWGLKANKNIVIVKVTRQQRIINIYGLPELQPFEYIHPRDNSCICDQFEHDARHLTPATRQMLLNSLPRKCNFRTITTASLVRITQDRFIMKIQLDYYLHTKSGGNGVAYMLTLFSLDDLERRLVKCLAKFETDYNLMETNGGALYLINVDKISINKGDNTVNNIAKSLIAGITQNLELVKPPEKLEFKNNSTLILNDECKLVSHKYAKIITEYLPGVIAEIVASYLYFKDY